MTVEALMHAILWVLVGLCLTSSVALSLYARFVLPMRYERRLRQSVRAFSTAIELRFPSHKGLSERVVTLSKEVGRRLKLDGTSLSNLELAAQLRDIGLCSIPYQLVNGKSFYQWDDADWATYHRHAEVSGAMLELVPHLRSVAHIVRTHHMPFRSEDEAAIPQGPDIPIEARIIHVVSDFVWTSRLQGSLLAKDQLKRGRGFDYDPSVVDALLQVLTSSRVESLVEPVRTPVS